MKKNILYFLALCVVFFSCSKSVEIPLSYSVTDQNSNAIQNVYIPDSGTATFPVFVKFLTGNVSDSVRLIISGLPAHVSVTPDTFSAKPTYTEDFTFTSNNAALGTYEMSIIAYTPTTGYKTYNFNLVIVPTNCASLFNGSISGTSACTGTSTATCAATDTGSLIINNFGGYGVNTNTAVVFNCDNGALTIPSQNIGNGITMQGSGTFTGTGMVISYTANNIPSGGSASCTITYTK